MTKAEIRKLYTAHREATMWAKEQIANAAHCAADNDVEGFQRCMAEAGRLTLISAKRLREHREAAQVAA